MSFLLFSHLRHLFLQVVEVFTNAHAFLQQVVVAKLVFNCSLLGLGLPVDDLLLEPMDAAWCDPDFVAVSLVRLEHFFVALNTGISVLLITVELKLETTVKQFDLLNQLVLHALKLFDVLVFRLLSCRFKRCLHLPELECFFFLDRFN
jgi:hypothetical protein